MLGICTGFVSRLLSPGATKYFPQCHTLSGNWKGKSLSFTQEEEPATFCSSTKPPRKKAVNSAS